MIPAPADNAQVLRHVHHPAGVYVQSNCKLLRTFASFNFQAALRQDTTLSGSHGSDS